MLWQARKQQIELTDRLLKPVSRSDHKFDRVGISTNDRPFVTGVAEAQLLSLQKQVDPFHRLFGMPTAINRICPARRAEMADT